MGVNSLPKTVTRQRHGCDLNPSPYAPESSTLTTRLPSHPGYLQNERHWNFVPNSGLRRFRRQLGHIAWSHCKTRRRSNWPVTTIDASWLDAHIVYYTSIDRNAVTPLLLLLVDLFCKLLRSCIGGDDILTDVSLLYTASRARSVCYCRWASCRRSSCYIAHIVNWSISHNVGYRDYKLSKSAIFVKFTEKNNVLVLEMRTS